MTIYNNIDQNASQRRLDIAIANRKKSAEELNKFNREQKLQIQQPPADFRTLEEAQSNSSYQNTEALNTLKTFMFRDDANASFSELLKNNQINEFNQYSYLFKQSIHGRYISYLEFLNLWNKFIEQIHNNSFLFNKPLLPFERKSLLTLESKIPKPRSKSESESKSESINPIKQMYNEIDLNNYNGPQLKKLYQDENLIIPEIKKEKGFPNIPLINLSTKEGKEAKKLIIEQLNERGQLHKLGIISPSKGLKKTSYKMKGGGFNSNANLIHRFNILSGEIQAGNDNQDIIDELIPLIDLMKSKKLLINI